MLLEFCEQQDLYLHQSIGTIHGGRNKRGHGAKRTRQDRFFCGIIKMQRIGVAQNQSLYFDMITLAAIAMGVSKGVKKPRMHEVGLLLCANTCLQLALEALKLNRSTCIEMSFVALFQWSPANKLAFVSTSFWL